MIPTPEIRVEFERSQRGRVVRSLLKIETDCDYAEFYCPVEDFDELARRLRLVADKLDQARGVE